MHSTTAATDSELSSLVMAGEVVLVDFSAPSRCAPCRQMLPVVARTATKLGNRCKVVMMDTDETSTHQSLGIRSIPTLVLVCKGQVVWKHEGLISESALVKAVSEFC